MHDLWKEKVAKNYDGTRVLVLGGAWEGDYNPPNGIFFLGDSGLGILGVLLSLNNIINF